MLNKSAFEYMKNLQYKVKDLTAQVKGFRTGEKYIKMQKLHDKQLATKDRETKKVKAELATARTQATDMRKKWQQVTEDMEKEHAKALDEKDREIEALKEKLTQAQATIVDQREKLKAKIEELYQAKIELEDEKGKVTKLKSQINRDYENSGIPSSAKPKRKKVTNNREKTGRKPGGQIGHKGHSRKKHEPTNHIEIPTPDKYLNSDYKPTGRIITKQLVDIQVHLNVTEFSTPEYRNVNTGQRVHADFPEGLVNEVTYGGGIKAFAFLLNNYCNVSIMKTSDFLCELTGGQLKVSAGMINGLSKAFSEKTESEQKKAFADMLLSPVVYADFTSARVNGENMAVLVCANNSGIIYFAKEHKGLKGIEGTLVEDYQGTLVHDHDLTFYNYGDNHQECLEHIRRYLKDSIANEPSLKWNEQMRQLLKEMFAFKNDLDPDDLRDPHEIEPDKVSEFVASYDKILGLAQTEYEYEPPNKYYMEGFNLYKRMLKYKSNHLLFLYDRNVSPTNNLSERLLRIFKRKQQQVMTFRSRHGLDSLCNSLGIIASIRNQDKNLFDIVSSIFSIPSTI